jgi:hypothetical protein
VRRFVVGARATRLFAVADLEPHGEGGAQEVAGGVWVRGGQARFTGRGECPDHGAPEDEFVVSVGDHQVPSRAEHTGELRHDDTKVRDVG